MFSSSPVKRSPSLSRPRNRRPFATSCGRPTLEVLEDRVLFDGTRWSVVGSPNATTGHNALNGVTALGTGTVVAVGDAIDANGVTNNLILQK